MRKPWTPEEDALFREHYPNSTMKQMVELLGRSECAIYNRSESLNVRKSQEYLDSPNACRLRRGDNIGAEFRFKKGQVPPNKGVKGISYEGSKPTQFKKGSRPPNYRPVGTIRVVDGYQEIKVEEGMRQWKQLHRVIWERLNGPIPKGYNLVFLDGNKENISIAKLSPMSKADNMRRNSFLNYPKEIADVIRLTGAINRQIKKRTNHEQHRHA